MRTPRYKSSLFYGDNLDVLRKEIEDESVDLIYLDPPFNSKRAYNIIYPGDLGQMRAFDDTWVWDEKKCKNYLKQIQQHPEGVSAFRLLTALVEALDKTQVCAYLVNMAIRLLELKRVLKKTGSLYLHCDPTASHYLKIVLDSIFGQKNFRNEIIWAYTSPSGAKKHFPRKHDVILFYSKSGKWMFNYKKVRVPYKKLETGKTKGIFKQAATLDSAGKIVEDWWADITPAGRILGEHLGYPTQKPEKLLERIIQASSQEGDVVLDPFCGCGTTIAVAQNLDRRCIGIDITYSAVAAIQKRYKKAKLDPDLCLEVIGVPKTVQQVEQRLLGNSEAVTRKEFEKFCVTQVGGLPNDKMGADGGIDGYIPLFEDKKYAVCQVKSGQVGLKDMHALKGVLTKDQPFGILLTKEPPTKPMVEFAQKSALYGSQENNKLPTLQILTLDEILKGLKPKL